MMIGHDTFPFSGGWPELLRRTRDEEWSKIKAHLDRAEPWPVGLIGETTSPTENHQILATGYEDRGDGLPVLFAYDSNRPGTESQLRMNFTGPTLDVYHSGYAPNGFNSNQGPIRGVYCEQYAQAIPPPASALLTSLDVAPNGTVPIGQPVRLRYTATNVGFGPSPTMRLYGVGRVLANGWNVDAGTDRPTAEALAEGGQRAYDKTVTLAGDLGLRRYSVGVTVEVDGAQAWRTLAPLTGASPAYDIVVSAPPSPWASLGGQLVAPPTVGRNADGRIVVVGIGLDGRLWRMEQSAPSNGWRNWEMCAPQCPELVGRASVSNYSAGGVEVFARAQDGQIYHAWQQASNSSEWAGWTGLGDQFASEPVAITNLDGRIEVFALSPDGRLRHKWQYPFGWNGWEDIGWELIGSPGAGRHGDGRLEVFVRHRDGSIFHTWQRSPGGGWDRAEFGGIGTSDIAVGTNADGRLEVFVRGTDGALWHRWIMSVGWSGWASLGGLLPPDATPFVTLNGAGGLEVFVHGTDNQIWHNWQVPPPQYWSGWATVGGGPVASNPQAVQNADHRLELLALGIDRTLVHRWQTGHGGDWNA